MFHVKHQTGGSNGRMARIPRFAFLTVLLSCLLACVVLCSCQTTQSVYADVFPGHALEQGASIIQENTDLPVVHDTVALEGESAGGTQRATAVTPAAERYKDAVYEQDVVLVQPSAGTTTEEVASALGVDAQEVVASSDGLLEISLPAGMSVTDAVDTLEASSIVDNVQPDFIYFLQGVGDASSAATEEASGSDETMAGEQAVDADITGTSVSEGVSDEGAVGNATDANPENPSENVSQPENEEESDESDQSSSTAPTNVDAEQSDGDADDESEVDGQEAVPQFLDSNDTYLAKQWALQSINAPQAWYLMEEAKTDPVSIAVIDEGFDIHHPDLQECFITTNDGKMAAYNALAETGDDPTLVPEINADAPGYGHGTHVAGAIAAQVNNATGIAGASCNQKIVPIKVFDDEGKARTSSLRKAYAFIMQYFKQYNIRVVNMSVGVTGGNIPVDMLLKQALDMAYDSGIVTVGSAGNLDGDTITPVDNYPSDYETIVSVINLEQDSSNADGVARSETSNYNRVIDGRLETAKNISAPGTEIYSTYPAQAGGYTEKTGTSMAAPHVSAVLAMVFSMNPRLTASEAVDALYSSARDLRVSEGETGFDAETGYGEVDAYAAVKKAAATTGSFDATGFATLPRTDWNVEIKPAEDNSDNQPTDTADNANTGGSTNTSGNKDAADNTDIPAKANTPTAVAKPSYSIGATKLPVGATSTWRVKHGSLKVVSGSDVVSIKKDGTTVKAKKPGIAKIAVVDEAGKKVKTLKLSVYTLSGKYMLQSARNNTLYLDANGHSRKTKSQAVLWKGAKANANELSFIKKGSYYQIKVAKTKKVLKAKGSSKKSGAVLIQAKKTSAKSQQWRITVDKKNRLTFINRASGKVLSVKGSAKKGAHLIQATSTGSTAEKWVLVQE